MIKPLPQFKTYLEFVNAVLEAIQDRPKNTGVYTRLAELNIKATPVLNIAAAAGEYDELDKARFIKSLETGIGNRRYYFESYLMGTYPDNIARLCIDLALLATSKEAFKEELKQISTGAFYYEEEIKAESGFNTPFTFPLDSAGREEAARQLLVVTRGLGTIYNMLDKPQAVVFTVGFCLAVLFDFADRYGIDLKFYLRERLAYELETSGK